MEKNKIFDGTGFAPADIMLPSGCDWEKWAVVACDQFTSQPEYWEQVDQMTDGCRSTRQLILPEIFLNTADPQEKIDEIHANMKNYMEEGVFQTFENALIYLERIQSDGRVRRGIIGMVDLEAYDYNKGSTSLIRATEGTVLERIPPRQAVRRDAPIELPHVMLLIDDPDDSVIGSMREYCTEKLYDFDLMEGGGHAAAWLIPEKCHEGIADALKSLKGDGETPILFAVGDGNHSLASAKACYEEVKARLGAEEALDHPARWALAEVVDLYDAALEFEPIHRVLFDVDADKVMEALRAYYPDCVDGADPIGHVMEWVSEKGSGSVSIKNSGSNLPVGALQNFLDKYMAENGGTVDYIHDDIAREMGTRPGCMAFMLPAIAKESLFESIEADGALPRKTFSMGHAEDKRYYIEARKIR